MGKMKLKWKIFTYLLLFSGLVNLILALFQTVLLVDMYKIVRTHEINRAIEEVQDNLTNVDDFYETMERLAREQDILVMPPREFDTGDRRLLGETITREVEFVFDNGFTIPLVFHAVIEPVDATVSTLAAQQRIVSTLMLGLSVLISFILARAIAKPIEELSKTAKSMEKGEYEVDFSVKGFREIIELSKTLNVTVGELSKTEQYRQEIVANVSHDLRTPLALIYSYAEMMNDFPEEVTKEQTGIIMEETKRLTTLVNDMLDMSKLQSGVLAIDAHEYNFTNSIKNSIERIAELVKNDGYIIDFIFTEEVFIKADEGKITQAFYNLLTNAITHTDKDKRVTIIQRLTGNSVKIEVVDYGDGIATNEILNIWDRYYKVQKNHKRNVIGTGLGLSIVRKIIDLHGGECGVVSEVSHGCIFWFEVDLDL